MNRTSRITLSGAALAGLLTASFTVAGMISQDAGDPPQLPPGWTMDDVTAAMDAAATGKMHEHLAKSVGRWRGEATMWVAPDVRPTRGENVSTVATTMGGKFTRVEMQGEWPGIGAYTGFGIFGYDNVTKQFQGVWIEDHSTGMSFATGKLSEDDSTMTWTYTYSCPIRKRPAVMRKIERFTGEDTKSIEMHSTCPKTDREFKMMDLKMTRVQEERE